MTRAEIRAEAKFRAGLIVESVLADGWGSNPDVLERYGEGDAARIEAEMTALASRLQGLTTT